MKSTVEVEIALPRARVAELYAEPRHTTSWMDDIARIETVSGDLGMPGSQYRLVPKSGSMIFLATVISRKLPDESRLLLDASNVSVSVAGTMFATAPNRTRLRSEEEFRLKGFVNRVFGFVAQKSIRAAHRRHIEAFKLFAERHG